MRQDKSNLPLTSFEQALSYLTRYYVNSTGEYTLENMRRLMDYLDNPQDKFKTVHVAGTSGKTSTVYYISAMLTASGYKTGLTVSPHVDAINERLQINDVPLPEDKFCQALTEFLRIIDESDIKPSWFEVMISFVYWYFAKAGVDYAVVEVGLGGLKDGTNVITRQDKVCVITDIGLDHIEVLGDNLHDIAIQKIGIVQPGNHVFAYRQSDEVTQAFIHNVAADHLHMLDEGKVIQSYRESLSSMPIYQAHNWLLAYEVCRYILDRDNKESLSLSKLHETQHVQVPGRMDTRQINGKTLVMDGAHNSQKMTAFLESFRRLYPGVKPAVLISLKEGKEYQELIPLLKNFGSRFIVTNFEARQDIPARSMDATELASAFGKGGISSEIIADQDAAFKELIKSPEQVLVITGSFYLLNQIRNSQHLSRTMST